MSDRPDRGVQANRVSKLVGDALGDRTGPAIDHVLLAPTLDGEQCVDASMPPNEEQQMQQRHVVQVAGEQTSYRHLEQVAGDRRSDPRLLADTFDGDDGDTLRGDESGCSVFIERVVNWVAGASK